MKILFILILANLFSCSSLFWRESKLPAELIFSENSSNLIYSRIYFEEKDSFDPTVANTNKKNYTTKFIPVKINSSKLAKELKEFETNSWILPKLSKYNFLNKKLFFIKGNKPDEFATPERSLVEYSLDKQTEKNLSKELNILNPIDFAISKNLDYLIILYKENSENFVSIFKNSENKFVLIEQKNLPKFVISGDGDSELSFFDSEVIIKGYKSCYSYQLASKKLNSCNPFQEYKNSKDNPYRTKIDLVDENAEFNQVEFK